MTSLALANRGVSIGTMKKAIANQHGAAFKKADRRR
jgi:hypothetical protein